MAGKFIRHIITNWTTQTLHQKRHSILIQPTGQKGMDNLLCNQLFKNILNFIHIIF